jgi:hypothetical protein
VDESGHSGDAGAAESGDGADSRERVRVNGWATPDSPWSQTGGSSEAENDVPAWRRSAADSRSFPRNQAFPSIPASGIPASSSPPAAAPAPPGFVDAQQSGEIPPSGEQPGGEPATRWSENRSRYADLLSPSLIPNGPTAGEAPRPSAAPVSAPLPGQRPEPGQSTGGINHGGLNQGGLGQGGLHPRRFDVPTPMSAPPYPYEGDLDDSPPAPAVQQRAPVPMVRPAAPGVRRAEWNPSAPGMEAARHSLAQTTPVTNPSPRPETVADPPARPSYDPSSFPRRLAYEAPLPVPNPPTGPGSVSAFAPPAPYSGFGTPSAEPAGKVLPQRVPAQPDVPRVPDPPLVEPTAETPALARIATHLRRGDMLPVQERQEGFDVQAILTAVREVDGVRDASLRSTPAGAHSLRLDLAEGADPAEVSRQVARLLQDRMGLDAAMKGESSSPLAAPEQPRPVPQNQQPRPVPQSHPQSQQPRPVPQSQQPTQGQQATAAQQAQLAAPTQQATQTQPATQTQHSSSAQHASPAQQVAQTRPVSPAAQHASPTPQHASQTSQHAAQSPPATPHASPATPTSSAERLTATPAQAPTAAPAPFAAATPVSPARPAPQQQSAQQQSATQQAAPQQQSAAAPVSPSAVVPATAPARPVDPAEREPAKREPAAERPAERSAERPVDLGDAVEPSEVDYAAARPLYPNEHPGPRIVIENVHVNTFGSDATVEVRLAVGNRSASGVASGPAVDGYLLRLCAMATAGAVDELLASSNHPDGPPRCFVEHAAAVPFGASQVAVVVLLLSCGGWVEQLAGSAVVTSDDRHAMVRATLAAVNRRLEALLS